MLESIGIDFPLLTFQIVNFLIFVWILKKYLYAPILKVISDRQQEIEKGLALKQKTEELQGNLAKEREQIVKEAQEEVQLLVERRKVEAEKLRNKIIAEARLEREAIIAQGKKDVQEIHREMEKEVQQEALNLATLLTEKILSSLLSEKKQHEIIQKELDKLSGAKFS